MEKKMASKACIANALMEKEKRVYMTDFATISSISTFESDEYIKSINQYDLLIIDDLGAERKYDRIRDMCTPVLVDGTSKRIESSEEKKEMFSRIFRRGR